MTTEVPSEWLNKTVTLQLNAINETHYTFAAKLKNNPESRRIIAYVPGEIISWGFTGAIVGAYATSNGGKGMTPAYISRWWYQGLGDVNENGPWKE